jgi:hypothetical protein
MIPGTPVEMSGQEWIIPPLTVRLLTALAPEIKIIRDGTSGVDLAMTLAIAKVVLTAMRRNYPNLTEDQLADMLDMGNLLPAFLATLRGPTIGGTPETLAAPLGLPRPTLSLVGNGNP